jgi:hypothetical protein
MTPDEHLTGLYEVREALRMAKRQIAAPHPDPKTAQELDQASAKVTEMIIALKHT